MNIILVIDQSTSASKGFLFSSEGKLLARSDVPHRQIVNDAGWVEHNPEEIMQNVLLSAKNVIETSGIDAKDISCIGITNQRETAVCWDKTTGKPLHNAVVWQCARAVDITDAIEKAGLKETIRKHTGLILSPFFSAAKYGWMVKHVPEVFNAKQKGTLCCGTIDSWLVFKLTGNYKTDFSNASRTQLLNLETLQWDKELVDAFYLNIHCLPEICFSDSLFGFTDFDGLLPVPVPIHGVLGDSHAALFGNGCWNPGMAKVTYGTGSSVMMNAGTAFIEPPSGIVTSIGWGINKEVHYVLEGNIHYSGAVINWLANDIELIENSKIAGDIAAAVENTGGVYLVPAFSGLGAPYFNNDARAAFLGMNRSTKKSHLVRAAEESIAFQIFDVVSAIRQNNKTISVLHADGGATHDAFLMQFQSDILGIPLEISGIEELSAFGAAACAAIGSGIVKQDDFFAAYGHKIILPKMDEKSRTEHLNGWKNAVKIINGK